VLSLILKVQYRLLANVATVRLLVEPLYLLLVIDLNMQLAKSDRRPDIAQIGHQSLEKCVKLLKDSIFAPMHGVFMDEGSSTEDPSFQSPITQTLKQRMEKMLIPFGITV
jgi:hypothetical protein